MLKNLTYDILNLLIWEYLDHKTALQFLQTSKEIRNNILTFKQTQIVNYDKKSLIEILKDDETQLLKYFRNNNVLIKNIDWKAILKTAIYFNRLEFIKWIMHNNTIKKSEILEEILELKHGYKKILNPYNINTNDGILDAICYRDNVKIIKIIFNNDEIEHILNGMIELSILYRSKNLIKYLCKIENNAFETYLYGYDLGLSYYANFKEGKKIFRDYINGDTFALLINNNCVDEMKELLEDINLDINMMTYSENKLFRNSLRADKREISNLIHFTLKKYNYYNHIYNNNNESMILSCLNNNLEMVKEINKIYLENNYHFNFNLTRRYDCRYINLLEHAKENNYIKLMEYMKVHDKKIDKILLNNN